jgi:hypothetical protein
MVGKQEREFIHMLGHTCCANRTWFSLAALTGKGGGGEGGTRKYEFLNST